MKKFINFSNRLILQAQRTSLPGAIKSKFNFVMTETFSNSKPQKQRPIARNPVKRHVICFLRWHYNEVSICFWTYLNYIASICTISTDAHTFLGMILDNPHT